MRKFRNVYVIIPVTIIISLVFSIFFNNEKELVENEITTDDNLSSEQRSYDELPAIVCWGDSHTAGAGGKGVNYPEEIEKLSGIKTFNEGVGGESTTTIECRQGTRNIMVKDITIPAGTDKVKIGSYNDLYDNCGEVTYPLLSYDQKEFTCSIAGVEGVLTATHDEGNNYDPSTVYYFYRNEPGKKVEIKEPTPIITDTSVYRKNDINIFLLGASGGYDTVEQLISQEKDMINYLGHDKYLILGIPLGDHKKLEEIEKASKEAFGDKFVDIRDYVSKKGMEDAGLNPTDAERVEMTEGTIPFSLRYDEVHVNSITYKLIAKEVYSRMLSLGYIDKDGTGYLKAN